MVGVPTRPSSQSTPVVTMIGGGQLARMTHQAAIALGQSLRVLAVAPDDGAALVAADTHLGNHTDLDALRRFAKGCDVITFDHEHVPTNLLHELVDAGIAVRPGPEALVHAQDKAVMRHRLSALGAPCPTYRVVLDAAGLIAFGDEIGWPVIAKTSRGGYDGKGVWKLDSAAEASTIHVRRQWGAAVVVEPLVGPVDKELQKTFAAQSVLVRDL